MDTASKVRFATLLIQNGRYEDAIDILRSIKHPPKDDLPLSAAICSNMGTAQRLIGDIAGSIASYNRALDIEKSISRSSGIGAQLFNLGLAYQANGSLKTAEKMFELAHPEFSVEGNLKGVAGCYVNRAIIEQLIQSDIDLCSYLKSALDIFNEVGAASAAEAVERLLNLYRCDIK